MSNKINLKENELVDEWLSEHTKGTIKVYIAALKQFLAFNKLTPETLLELAQENGKKVRTKLNLFYKHQTEVRKKSWNCARSYENAIKSFYRYHEAPIKTKRRSKAILNERKPLRQKEVKKLIEYTRTVRDKALYCVAFQSGMSIIDILTLNYGDVQDALENEQNYHIISYIRIKGTLNAKALIGRDSITLLNEYMAFRKRKGEHIEENSPLFVGEHNGNIKRLMQGVAQRNIKESAIKAGLLKHTTKFNTVGFHALRSGFASIAKINGMPVSQIELALGHSDPYERAYDKFKDSELLKNYQEIEEALSISEGAKYNNRIEELEVENEKLLKRIEILETHMYKPITEKITDDKDAIESHEKLIELIKKAIKDEMNAATKHLE